MLEMVAVSKLRRIDDIVCEVKVARLLLIASMRLHMLFITFAGRVWSSADIAGAEGAFVANAPSTAG